MQMKKSSTGPCSAMLVNRPLRSGMALERDTAK